MPDLGSYAVYVIGAYAVSLGLIGALVWASVARARKVRAQLDEIERRPRNG